MGTRRAPLDRLVDLAVAVPTCTFVAATRAVPIAARVGTLGTARLIGRVSDAVHDLRHGDEIEAMHADLPDGPDGDESRDDVRPTIAVDELAIAGYDDLAARQVVDRLSGLDRADLARVETYEREHRNRSTVLGKISMLIT
jgi:hypothetical protein